MARAVVRDHDLLDLEQHCQSPAPGRDDRDPRHRRRQPEGPQDQPLLPVFLDLLLGPMARSVDDLVLALDIIAGPDEAADGRAYRLNLPPAGEAVAGVRKN